VRTEISVVIPTRGRPRELELCLRALAIREDSDTSAEVIVVDDGGRGEARAIAAPFRDRLRLEVLEAAGGSGNRARARNQGVRAARGRVVLLLDDDMIAPPRLLSSHAAAYAARERIAVLGRRRRVSHEGWSRSLDLDRIAAAAAPDLREESLGDPRCLELGWSFFATCHASAPRRELLDAGLFDEAFVGWGFEDTELAYRLARRGIEFVAPPEITAVHLDPEDYPAGMHRLPADKLESYRINRRYFLEKYADDDALRRMLDADAMLKEWRALGLDTLVDPDSACELGSNSGSEESPEASIAECSLLRPPERRS
jgi:glycosyltransferase involved in cell wall biosynthesis